MNPNEKVLIEIIISVYEGGPERGTTASVYLHVLGQHLSLWCRECCQNGIMNAEKFNF